MKYLVQTLVKHGSGNKLKQEVHETAPEFSTNFTSLEEIVDHYQQLDRRGKEELLVIYSLETVYKPGRK